jgi:uncharacterized membrane protein
MFSKHRLEALSDGIFAIAMTLLILDITIPENIPRGGLDQAIASEGHSFISFIVTFVFASIFWTIQHKVFDLLDKVGALSVTLTFVALGFVTLLPFTTSVWGHHIKEPLAFTLYFGNQFAISAALMVKLELARANGDVRHSKDTDMVRIRLFAMSAAMGAAAIASRVLPLQDIWMVVVPFMLATAWLKRRQKNRWERLNAAKRPSLP